MKKSAFSSHSLLTGPVSGLATPSLSTLAGSGASTGSGASVHAAGRKPEVAAIISKHSNLSNQKNAVKGSAPSLASGSSGQPATSSGLPPKTGSTNVHKSHGSLNDLSLRRITSSMTDLRRDKDGSSIRERSNMSREELSADNPHKLTGCFKSRSAHVQSSEIYSAKFSLDDEYLAIGLGDMRVQIYHVKTNKFERTLDPKSGLPMPCTCVAFRPGNGTQNAGGASVIDTPTDPAASGAEAGTRNVMMAAYADGRIIQYHVTSGKQIAAIVEKDNQVNIIQYSLDGSKFATGGSDAYVRVYDEASKKRILSLYAGDRETTAGHSARIFAVKFHPKDQHLLISSGWDNTVQFWDTRVENAVRSIYGPHICGDALDFTAAGDTFLTGSYVKDEPLKIWSFKEGRLIENINWSISDEKKHCLLYSAQFSKSSSQQSTSSKYILAGGGGAVNEAKLFDVKTKRCVGMASDFTGTVYTTAISHSEKIVAVGGALRVLNVYDIEGRASDYDFVY